MLLNNSVLFLLNSFPIVRVKIFLYGLVFVISLFILMKILSEKNHFSKNINLPPETWFYSKLIDIELGAEKQKKILPFFLKYVSLKYQINPLDKSNFVQKIDKVDEDNRVRGFLKGYFKELLDLEKNNFVGTIEYIKETKMNFNRVDLSDWLKEYDRNKKNNC